MGLQSARKDTSKRALSAVHETVVPIELGRKPDSLRLSSRPIVRIHLLGPLRATTYLGADALPRGRKARAILGCLCLASGTRVARNRLAAMLWDRVPDFQARASFRQASRELVVSFGPLAKELLVADRETVSLNINLCWIDALAMLASELKSSPRGDLAALCSGDLLEELDGISTSLDQWLLSERTHFTERVRALLESELHEVHNPDSDANQRASIARRLIKFDPTHEGASRILMRALADMGERAQALREYARCRDALKLMLDVEPSPETQALEEAIRVFPTRDETVAPVLLPARKKAAKAREVAQPRTRLRVGVLPFLAPPTPRDESLSISLSQEIAAALARFRWFDVIAPLTLMRKPTMAASGDDMLRRNELDYVVDGAISIAKEKYHINVRLLDLTRYATPVWSDRFELGVDELHLVDEKLTARIVGQIDPVILYIEGQPRRREHYSANQLLLRAIQMMFTMERGPFEEAGRQIERAFEIDPEDAMTAAWASFWEVIHIGQGWDRDIPAGLRRAREYALRAMTLDPENAEALGMYAHVCAFLDQDFHTAKLYFDRSLRLNPNLCYIWALSAMTYCYLGKPEEALARLARYRDLAPFDPYFRVFETMYPIVLTFKGDYEEAVAVGQRVIRANTQFVNSYKAVIIALGHLDRIDEAKAYVATLLELEPDFTISQFIKNYPIKRETDRERFAYGLRVAGVPEG